MPFYGKSSDGLPFNSFSRAVLTPLSVTYAPATRGGTLAKSFYLRGEATFFPEGFGPGDFDNRLPRPDTKGEWNFGLEPDSISVAGSWRESLSEASTSRRGPMVEASDRNVAA
jgi:hypothetical protein